MGREIEWRLLGSPNGSYQPLCAGDNYAQIAFS